MNKNNNLKVDGGNRKNPSSEIKNRTENKKEAPGINSPDIALPAFNPPVPNRAWTEMKKGLDIDALSEEEKRELYYGRDPLI